MALLWFGGFEGIRGNNSQIVSTDSGYFTTKNYGVSGTNVDIVSAYKTSGNYSLRMKYDDCYLWFDVGNDAATIICGVAVLNSSNPNSGENLIEFSNEAGDLHCSIRHYVSDGVTYFTLNNSGGTTLATSSGVSLIHTEANDNWWYIEVKITIHATAGACQIYINGVSVMSETTLDTYNTGTAGVGRLLIGHTLGVFDKCYFDDLYVCDTTGASPTNDILGPVKIDKISPNADGNYDTQWTANTGDRYAALDEDVPDNDTTYVHSSTVADRISTQFENVTISNTIFGIAFRYILRYEGYTAIEVTAFLRIGSTDYDNASDDDVLSSYIHDYKIYALNPADSAAWEDADIDALEAGIYLKSITT